MDQKPETPSLPLITRFKLWLVTILTNAGIRPDGTLNRRFRNLVDFKSPANITPIQGVKSYDVSIDPDRNLWFRVFVPDVSIDTPLPVIVYYHGGGFAFYSPDSSPFDGLCCRFASNVPAVVVSASYRLTPENRFPSQYDDGIDVLKFLDEDQSHKSLPDNADMRRCFVSGDSAGGNLAHHVCVRASQNSFQQLKVIGLVALQPFFGGEERTPSELSPENSRGLELNQTDIYWNLFKPLSLLSDEEWDRDNEVINVSGPRAADISELNFPKTLVVVGGRDILLDRQMNYYDWLKKSGKAACLKEYPYMFHGFYAFTELEEAIHVISVVRDFVLNTSREWQEH
ncbi:Alpha/beta hydrolase fold-3 [Artemisia annua]|uniref:Alpha/beta hydrolase fold-3 n=1 Tax=Artemisia annua TaxID=35608 RepID=A0A2U1LXF4_ARTAN|nr:Alpha/beta hydrolase fold-3 [Artemisia annua]